MEIHPSALKHGMTAVQLCYVAEHFIVSMDLGEDPHRELRLGFDQRGRLREVVILHPNKGEKLIIHGMRAREKYIKLLPF
ncbi:MAG: toxin [Angustibacter sp.]